MKKAISILLMVLVLVSASVSVFAEASMPISSRSIIVTDMQQGRDYTGTFKDTMGPYGGEADRYTIHCPAAGRIRVTITHNNSQGILFPGDPMVALNVNISGSDGLNLNRLTADQYITTYDFDVSIATYTIYLEAGRMADFDAVYTIKWSYI